MTQAPAITKPENGKALAQYGSRDDVREMVGRLRTMLPGGEKLTDGQIKALAQASLAHDLDPLNGEIWMIPGKGLAMGVKGLRRKAHDQVKGNFWVEFSSITDPKQRDLYQIPAGALAFEAHLFDSENIRTYVEACERLLKAGIPWDAVRAMVGDRPYSIGVGVFLKGEATKMQPVQCAMKRAEADAIKRRFDIPFGIKVMEDQDQAPETWTETVSGDTTTSHDADAAALYGSNAEADQAIVEAEKAKA